MGERTKIQVKKVKICGFPLGEGRFFFLENYDIY